MKALPEPLLPGKAKDYDGWPAIGVKMSPQLKANLTAAWHAEGVGTSLSDYVRRILVARVMEVLEISQAQAFHQEPVMGGTKGRRFARIPIN